MSQQDSVVVQLLGQDYRVACQPEEVPMLHQSANLLQQRMQAIEASGKVVGMDRICVMAALNLAHELLQAQTAPTADARIQTLHTQVEEALNMQNYEGLCQR